MMYNPNEMMKSAFLYLLMIGVLGSAGCVREIIEPEHSPRVTTSQNGEGLVTVSWKSNPAYDYILHAMDPDSHQWNPVKGATWHRGTGEVITVQDKRNPRETIPWYSVHSRMR